MSSLKREVFAKKEGRCDKYSKAQDPTVSHSEKRNQGCRVGEYWWQHLRFISCSRQQAQACTSCTVCATTNRSVSTSFGMSGLTSFQFVDGTIPLSAPARCAPSTFSLTTPTSETHPRTVIWTKHVKMEHVMGVLISTYI